MKIEDFVERSFSEEIDASFVEEFCQDRKIGVDVFMDRFARRVVDGYLTGAFTWPACDAAMNRLNTLLIKHGRFHGYAFEAFLAFEVGEVKAEGMTADEKVKPWLEKLVAKYH